jgi:PAS domain S-box-containing protein
LISYKSYLSEKETLVEIEISFSNNVSMDMSIDNESTHTILLVDDNPQNLAALSKILTEQGYHIRTAINGQVALKSVQTIVPDLILLDIRMPGLDGYEVCQQLKADETTREIPVLFLSALDHPADKVKAFEVGGVDYITKPFQADEIVARVETHIALCTMQKQLQEQKTQLQEQNKELEGYRNHLEDLVMQRTAELARTNTLLHEEIAERKRAQQALQLSEQQYRLLAEKVKDGIAIVQAGKVIFTNTAFATMVGYTPEQLHLSDFVSLFPEQEQMIQARLAHIEPEFSESPWQAELVIGEQPTIWIEVFQAGMMWENQPAILLTVHDITERKHREIRLEQERTRLRAENLTLKSTLMDRYKFGALVGKSSAMQRVYELIVNAATSDVNVLICGESGTGKELIAHTIHQVGNRRAQTFVPVNCASIPDTLFEREFFGHRKGAFTGADRDHPGLFDRAHQGVLFLDEVTELSPGAQAKLLRVLQDGEYTPLGSNMPKQADVVIIAATNKNYNALLEQGLLREDFFYRIYVIEIRVPPLRERKDDIPLLIEYFLGQYRQKQEELPGRRSGNLPGDPTMLPAELLQALYAYQWPGNVRELENVLQRYLATSDLDKVLSQLAVSTKSRHTPDVIPPHGMTLPEAIKAVERRLIADALASNQNQTGKTAEMLGIPQSTLYRKIKQYRLFEKRLIP